MRTFSILILFLLFGWICAGAISLIGSGGVGSGGEVSLDTGHSLGDMEACYILNEGEGTTLNDLTANGYDLTLSGGYSWPGGSGVYFDGTDAAAIGTHVAVTAYPFSMVLVMKTSDTATNYQAGVSMSDIDVSYRHVTLAADDQGGNLNATVEFYTDATNWLAGSTTLSTATEYVIVAVITDATDREIFLDGSTDGTDIDSDVFLQNPDSICLGTTCDSTPDYGQGTIYAAYIYDRVLSGAEVTSISADPYQMINNYSGH